MTFHRRTRSARGSGPDLRAEILAATRTLLAETGSVSEVSIRAIGKAVGVSAPSIYRHFADKEVLIETVVANVLSDMDTELQAAAAPDAPPLERMRAYGLAYVRFARQHPEHYRIATMRAGTAIGEVDLVLTSGVFQRFADAIRDCMEAGLLNRADPITVTLEMWAAAHGIASLLIAKPYLPWGDPEVVADRVLRAACVGRAVGELMEDDVDTAEVTDWIVEMRKQGPTFG